MTSIIDPGAVTGRDVTVGEFTVIEAGVTIGDGTVIGHHVVIRRGTKIGANVRIDDHAVIGKLPLAARRSKTTGAARELPGTVIGDDCLLGTGAIVYAGAVIGAGVLVADGASVREDSSIGDLTIVGRNATIDNRVTIGARCKIQTNVYICAYSTVGDDCFIAPCAATSNDNYAGRWKERTKYYKGVTVEAGGRIGVGAVILPGKVIHADGMAAAGAVVTHDIPAATVVCGNPAQTLRRVPDNQLIANQED